MSGDDEGDYMSVSTDGYTEGEAPMDSHDEEIFDGHTPGLVTTLHEQAAAIAKMFTTGIQYEDDEQVDIFHDGVEGDESSDSEMSATFEELEDPELVTKVIRIPASEHDEDDEYMGEEFDDQQDPWDDEDLDSESGSGDGEAESPASDSSSTEVPPRGPKTFAELKKHKFELSDYKVDATSWQSSYHTSWQSYLDRQKWELKELEEAKAWIEVRIPQLVARIVEREEKLDGYKAEFEKSLNDSGISSTLFAEYEAFCDSLNPKFGQRGGFSVTSTEDHAYSYVAYDPKLELFKDCVEMPYNGCNFRCEASSEDVYSHTQKKNVSEYVVEFWPIEGPDPSDDDATWGTVYVSLLPFIQRE